MSANLPWAASRVFPSPKIQETQGMSDPGARAEPLPLTLAPDLSQTQAADIEVRLGELIRRYAHEGTRGLGEAVVAHIEALCQHPDMRDPALFCAYRQLAHHWRWLTHRHGQTSTQGTLPAR